MKFYIIIFFALLFSISSNSQNQRFYDNTAGTNNWSDPGNWQSGDIADDNTDMANLSADDVTLDADYTIQQIRINNNATGANDKTISGTNTLTLDNRNASSQAVIRHNGNNGTTLFIEPDIIVDNGGAPLLSWFQITTASSPANKIVVQNKVTVNSELLLRSFTGEIILEGELHGSSSSTIRISHNSNLVTFSNTADNTNFSGVIIGFSAEGISNIQPPNLFSAPNATYRATANFLGQKPGSLEVNGADTFKSPIEINPGNTQYTFYWNEDQNCLGTLDAAGGNLIFEMGSTNTILQFQNSSAFNWGGSLIINNFEEYRIRFGTDNTGLTPAQLGIIDVGGPQVAIDPNGWLYYPCTITDSGLSNVVCNDNGTPSNPSDDYYTFDLDPIGGGLGSTYTVSGTDITTVSNNSYGSSTSFSTLPGSAGFGDLTITIADDNDTNCTLDETIVDLGSCSNQCNINSSGITNVQCNNNGTPSDPSDDYYTFDLEPGGVNLAAGYSINGTDVNNASANYGGSAPFSTSIGSAGNGDIDFDIIDDNDALCIFAETIVDRGTCSDDCDITDSGITNIQCNDNGTPTDPNDDFYTFDLNPIGGNLAPGYSVTGTDIISGSANYGAPTSFSTNVGTAGNGNIDYTITDDNDGLCTFDDIINDIGTCSDDCDITDSGITNIRCDDNGTPSDPSDDFYTFNLSPTGVNLAAGYSVTGVDINNGSANYGAPASFSTNVGTAGNGNIDYTIIDDDDGLCTFDGIINDIGTCSDDCDITDSGITNIQCNDNGTSNDPSDDFYTFDLNPIGVNLAVGYSVTGVDIINGSANYGAPVSFSTNVGTAGNGNIDFTIIDDDDGLCTFDDIINDIGTCSDDCDITDSGITNIRCDDNGTPSDPNDDFYTFDLNPIGVNLAVGYSVTGVDINNGSANYGAPTSFSTNVGTAGNGNIDYTIIDDDDGLCTFDGIINDIGTCSDDCDITDSGITNIQCNDNGTQSNPNDDFYTFDLNPIGVNLAVGYSVSGIDIVNGSANYGAPASFSTSVGTAGSGNIDFTITDDDDGLCTFDDIINDIGTCSDDCDITASGISNIQCNDNGTPNDSSDDFYTFDLNPIGANLAAGYSVTGTDIINGSANYGAPTSFSTNIGTAGTGNIDFTIIDDDDGICTFDGNIIDIGTCSNGCDLTASGISNIRCEDNGTPSNPSDDFYTFDLNPVGINLAAGYSVDGIDINNASANYGAPASFSTNVGTAGIGDIDFTITDDDDGLCTLDGTITDIGTCSNACDLTASGISNIQCNDNGTPSDPSDDFITFELDPIGVNLGGSYNIVGISVFPAGGNYGSATIFETDLGTAGAGNLNFTIVDDADGNCRTPVQLTDPGSCSPDCEMLTTGITNITCNDNGTPSDASDDFITFDLNPTGNNLVGNYTVSGTTVSPSTGNYGSSTNFATDPGTAGAGNLTITVTDSGNSSCSLIENITDPGTCSGTCNLTASGLSNVQCNDNGTPNDPSDDYITFDLDPIGINLDISYSLTGAAVTPGGGDYDEVTSFTTPIGTAGNGDLNLTIEDDGTAGCIFGFTVIDPGTCSNDCELTSSGISFIECNDNNTPSDPSDDFITFELDPSGFNLSTFYEVSGIVTNPTTGNYGGSTIFSTQPGTAGAGNFDITITDASGTTCFWIETVTDPGTCSGNCSLQNSGLSNVTCDDNGTPTDTSDDFITFDLDPTGANLGTSYTISGAAVTPPDGNYGTATNFSTAPGTAGQGDLNITIIDDDADLSCLLLETIVDPGTCSGSCNITTANITNIQCNDNNTPSDSSDDFITFEINPMGSNLGTNYSVTGANLSPANGTYGTPQIFQTDPGTAGAGDIGLTIVDGTLSTCTFEFDVIDPGNCSNACSMTSSGISNIQCNDNNTPSDPSDDFITFELNPMGSDLGTSYSVSGATLTPSGGNYGSSTLFSTNAGTAGMGGLNLTITDDTDTNCTVNETVADPGTCSNSCSISQANVSNIQCNNNGTPTNPNDDFITFDLNPTGSNLGADYTINGTALTLSTANYGNATTFSTQPGTAGAGNLSLNIIDGMAGNCTFSFDIIDPGSCSADCSLIASGLTNVTCNDNGTPTDDSDDFITFELNPSGTNLGTSYTLNGGGVTTTGGNYGSTTQFSTAPTTAGLGDLNLIITDATDPNCIITETVIDPGTCSGSCNIVSSGISNIQCNDNNTPNDPTDDFITFDLNPQGSNIGSGYTLNGATLSPNIGTYGSVTNFSTTPGTAGDGNLNLSIIDDATTGCSFGFTVDDPGSCSNTCLMSASGVTNIQCNDNNTPSDSSDDFFTFELNPTGSNLGTMYTVSGANLISNIGTYGAPTTFSTQVGTAGMGDLNITIADDADANCSILETVTDPGTCSGSCNFTSTGLTNIQCNDNNTPTDDSDDFFTFELNPIGGNLGTTYTVSGANLISNIGTYGAPTTFSTQVGTAGIGDLNITITDDADANCSILETVTDPGTCSGNCNFTSAGLTNIQCNDNNTPTDDSDDFFTFELNPTGSNLGTTYTVSGANLVSNIGTHGAATTFSTQVGTAGMGDLNITIADDADANCSILETVTDPGTCSSMCTIASSGLSTVRCNDNGTSSDPSDDFITFNLNPTGGNIGTTYTVTSASMTTIGGTYGAATMFSTNAGTAGMGDVSLRITDDQSTNCFLPILILDTGNCSSSMCNINNAGLTNIQCNDNGTPADESDDYITFELNPTGSLLGTNYTVSGGNLTSNIGSYGAPTSFSTQTGTAGMGNLSIAITDDTDTNCSITETVTDPGTCSNTCIISDSGLSNVNCNDNGTPGDPSDDYITFNLNPTGDNLGTTYNVTSASMVAATGSYGMETTFSTTPGTAGMGNVSLTISDADASTNCDFSISIVDPGTCSSSMCNINDAGLSNIQCNDNGTPADETDDYITFELNPTGSLLGTSYTIIGGNLISNMGTYGGASTFSTQVGSAGMGDLNLTINDGSSANCTFNFTVSDPGTCKDCAPYMANISAPPSICLGETVDLTFTFTGGTAPYTIQYSDGQSANDITTGATGVLTETVTLTTTTTFTITEITDANGCTGTPGTATTIEVFAEANNAFSDSFCEGTSYQLPDGRMVSSPDTYEVTLANQSINGCDSMITINLSQNQSYNLSESMTICDANSFDWGGQTYTTSDTYIQNLQTAAGCDSTLSLNLTFDGFGLFGESADAGLDMDECANEAELFGLDVTGTSGRWISPTGANISPDNQGAALATGLSAGENQFIWTLSTADCGDFDSDTVVVNVVGSAPILEDDIARFEIPNPVQIQILNNDDLSGISQFTVTCFGLSPEITDCSFDANNNSLNLQVAPEATGNFEVFYSICSEACPDICDTAMVDVQIEKIREQTENTNYIITPAKKDGLNDQLVFDNLEDFPDNELIIYNRWGSVVYRAKPYDNTWNGMRNGKWLPEADYYYVMRKKLPENIIHGNVTLRY